MVSVRSKGQGEDDCMSDLNYDRERRAYLAVEGTTPWHSDVSSVIAFCEKVAFLTNPYPAWPALLCC